MDGRRANKQNGRRSVRFSFGWRLLLGSCFGVAALLILWGVMCLSYGCAARGEKRTQDVPSKKISGRDEEVATRWDVDDIIHRAVPRPPHAWPRSYTPIALPAGTRGNEADIVDGLLFFLPPEQQRQALMRRLRSIMEAGPRVAGSLSQGQMKVMNMLARNGTWRPPRELLFTKRGLATLASAAASHWNLEWDNFTHSTPLGERRFFNLIFTFSGGVAFQQKSERAAVNEERGGVEPGQEKNKKDENEEEAKGSKARPKGRRRGRPLFSFSPDHNFTDERLRHVVLSAHWDSKYYTNMNFLGASDSAVPMVYLLETMRLISVLSDTAAALGVVTPTTPSGADHISESNGPSAQSNDETLCRRARQALSQSYLTVLRYYYAQDEGSTACLGGGTSLLWRRRSQRGAPASSQRPMGGDWLQLLRLVSHLPAISVVLFDGEEAFVKWRKGDNTYGSSHLAKLWKMMDVNGNINTRTDAGNFGRTEMMKDVEGKKEDLDSASRRSNELTMSRFDSVDLFVLYDIMGNAGTQFQNFFPDQSGKAFARLADIERTHRRRAADIWRLHGGMTKGRSHLKRNEQLPKTSSISASASGPGGNGGRTPEYKTCSKRLPVLWCVHGPPHDMFTLYGVPRLTGISISGSDLANLWVPPVSGSAPGGGGEPNRNVFFPLWQASAQGPTLLGVPEVMDDHIHWVETERVLHLLPVPFPPSWHTARDNESEIDSGTLVDLFRVLCEFSLHLGEGWMSMG